MVLWIASAFAAYFVKGVCGFANTLVLTSILSFRAVNADISPIDLLLGYPSNLILAWRNRRSLDPKVWIPLSLLVLAGSIPTVLPSTIYRDIMKRLQKREVMIVVDATKNLLVNVLEYHPFLIKPNNYELGEIFGVTLSTKEDVILYAKKLQEMGAANVLVSMAGDGAVLVAEDGSTYKSEAPEGKVKNSVGAGDSMVAGFLYGYLKSGIYEDAFYYGVCTGSASAFSENLATREEVDTLLRNIKNRA